MVRKAAISLPPLEGLERGKPKTRSCAFPGCAEPGEYKAPSSPDRLYEYQWFCLEHARAFNEGWNFFAGKTPGEIEAHIRSDTIGHRPTRTYSLPPGMEKIWRRRILRDFAIGGGEEPVFKAPRLPGDVKDALAVFGYAEFPGLEKLHARFRELVKKHHPDRHGGSAQAEENIKKINQAWRILKDYAA